MNGAPEIKVGDVVIVTSASGVKETGIVTNTDDFTVTLDGCWVAFKSQCEVWKPKRYELFWNIENFNVFMCDYSFVILNEGEVIKVLTSFNEKHKQDTMQTYHISKCRPFVDKYPKDVARRITEIIASKK